MSEEPNLRRVRDPMSIVSMPRWKAEQFDREMSVLKAEVNELRLMLLDSLDWGIEASDDLHRAGYIAGAKQMECLYQSERLVCEAYRKENERLNERLREGLTALYGRYTLAVALLCDDFLDRSGHLLGEIRLAALDRPKDGGK